MKRFIPYVAIIILCLTSVTLKAATITATPAGGDWHSASTWVGGIVPGASDNVIIPSGSTVTFTGTGVTPDAYGNTPFVNPSSIKVNGSFVLATPANDPVFQTPVVITVLSGGSMTDNTVGGEYWLQETSNIYINNGATYNAILNASGVLDAAYEGDGYPPIGRFVSLNGATQPGPFYVTVGTTSTTQTFGSPAVAPTATSVAATGVTNNAATLNGTVNDNDNPTNITFTFGTDPALAGAGTASATPSAIGAGAGNTNVTYSLTGLTYSTKYYYQVSATNNSGTTKGAILNFTTAPVVYNVSVPGNGVYGVGQQLVFTIGWTYILEAPMVVSTTGGTPYINVTIGNKTRKATLLGADVTNAVVYFGYTVQPGDYAPAGIVLGPSIILNGGTIKDQFGDPVGLSVSGALQPIPPTSGVIVLAPAVPLVTTGAATGVTTAAANLAGAVDDSGATTATSFLYGTNPTLAGASTVTATPSSVAAGTGNTAVTASLRSLTYSTKYYYAVSGTNSAGTSNGTINNFTTAPVVYSVSVPANGTYTAGQQLIFSVGWTYITEAPMVVTTTGGTPYINVTVGNKIEKAVLDHADPTNAVVYFIYTVQPGDYTASGINLGASIILNGGTINDQFGDAVGLSISGSLQAVPPLTGVNVSAPAIPIATTGASDLITSSGATIYGAVDDSGATTAVTFKYGTSATLAGAATVSGVINSIAAGTGNTTDSVVLTGLTPGTQYYYQVVASNSQGTVPGAILSFTTAPDQPPVITTTGGTTAFTAIGAGSIPVIVDNGVTASDPDNTTLASATVSISANFSPGDILGITLSGATGTISAAYNATTGVLTLNGSGATVAQFNAALQSVTFTNTNANPSLNNRTISFLVNDGTSSSSAAIKTVAVVAGLTFTGGATQASAVCENSAAQAINTLFTTTDPATGQTLTYTVVTAPSHGTLGGFPYATASTGSNITPAGLTYLPTAGYSGPDAFTIQVSNGSASIQTAINMTVNAQTALTPISGPASVCAGANITLSSGPAGGAWSSDNTVSATVDAATGVVTGQAQGNANILYTYTNGSGCASSVSYAVDVNPAPATPSAISGSGSVTNEQTGVAYSVTNVAGVTYTWSYTGTGVTINGSSNAVTVDFGPTATSGTLSVTATSSCGVVSTPSTLVITVTAPTIFVSPATLPPATVGTAYSQTLGATGGMSPYSYSVTAGALPAGVSLSTAGVLSGTPTAGGSFNVTVTATDASGFPGTLAYTLTVNAATISVAPTSLPAATVATAYSQAVTATGGTSPYTYAVTSGTLPAGLSLSTTGVLSGTPTAGGSFNFTITATDVSTGSGPYTGSQAYTLTVNAATISIAPTTLPAATVASAYTTSVSATGGTSPYTYAVTSGSLPAGLTLATDGTLSGTPTAGGSFNFTITATDASTGAGPYSGSQAYTLTVSAATIALAPTTLPAATVASAYTTSVSASGGTSPYTYAVTSGSLPTGLSLSTAGVLSGTPTAGGSFNFTITATDASTGAGPYTGSQAYTLTVNAATISIAPTTLPAATVASAYTTSVSASGGTSPYTYAVTSGSLPTGLTLATDGTLSGTPTAGGSFNFTITATDASAGAGPYTGSQAYTLTVSAATIALAPTTLPAATVASAYTTSVSATGGTSPYTYAVTSGSLPAGLSLSTAGVLSGTPTAGGSFNFTITATDASTGSGPYTGSQAYTLTVNAATISIAPTTLPGATVASAYTTSVSASGGTSPYTYAVTSGSLPAGLTLATDGTLSGTPTAGGSFNFTITATDASTGAGPYSGSQAYTLTVNAATITVAPTTLPAATVASAYITSVSATGGTSPYTYAVTSGSLPTGLTLATDGTLSGTPTAGGSFNFTITATDASAGAGPYTGSQAYTLTVSAATIALAPTTLPAATVASAYTTSVSATGGTSPYTYAVTSGSLPTGLTLSTGGTLSGTPTAGGSFSFTITATDASTGAGPYAGSQAYTLTVNAATINIAPTTLPAATVASAYTTSVSASGGTSPYTYAVTSGSLPTGLTLATDGTLSGTPTAGGSFNFTITATDASTGAGPYSGSQAYTLTVSAATISIAPTTLPAATVASAYTTSVSASGGTSPYTYAVTSGSLPAGMTLSTGGTLSGTPTAGGSFSFTITATDASAGSGPYTGSQAYTLTVNAAAIAVAPTTLPAASVATAYSQSITASGGTSPYTYAVTSGNLPTGMTLSTGGTLSGTPTAGGSFSFTITATDASSGTGPYTGSQSYTLTVNPPAITLTPATLPAGTVASAYTTSVSAAGGVGPYTYAVTSGSLPTGLTLATDGTLSGTPTAGGSFTFTITATDVSTGAGPYTGSQSYTLTVNPPSGISLTPGTLPAGSYGQTYAGATFAAAGGTAPYGFAVTSGNLPPGLSLSTGGVLSGTPTQVGDYTFTVMATDASSGTGPYTGSASYTVHIAPATLTITAANQSMTYGGTVPALTVAYSGFVNGDNSGSLTTLPTVSTTATSATGIGQYPITVSGAVDPNYTIVYVNGTLTINPADLLVTAAPVTRYYNTPNPVLTYTYSGFVNGDNASVLTSTPTITTSAVQTSAPGQYPITLSGGAAANYTLLYQDAVLTVLQSLSNLITFTPLPVKTYGDPDFDITATANSGLPVRFVSQDASIATVTQDGSGNWVVHIVAAGQVTISAFQDGNGMYTAAPEVDQTLQINKASQTITFPALPATQTTTSTPVLLAATASSGLPVTYTLSDPTLAAIVGNQLEFTGAGTLTVTANQAGDNDYNAAPPVSYTITLFNGAGFVSHIGVFPNPAHGTLHIRFSSDYLITKYIIFSMNGQVVRGETDVTNNNNDLQVNIGDLSPGYYLVRVVCIRNRELVYPVFKILVY